MPQKPSIKLSEFLSQPHSSFWLLIACSLWLAGLAWVRPLSLPDEGRYVGVAWEMLNSGNWLVPTLDGLPFFHKPPLFYWITAASLEIFGPIEWAGRAASFLSAIAVLFRLHSFLKTNASKDAADIAVIILATQPFFYGAAQFANLDMLVASLITLAVLNIADAVLSIEQQKPAVYSLLFGHISAALAVLAKGLIGIVLPALIVFLWLVFAVRLRTIIRLLNPFYLIVMFAIAVPWFVAMSLKFPDFFEYFFIEQHFKRFSGTGFNNARPFWFYIPVIILLIFPWSIWLIPAIKNHYKRDTEGNNALPLLMIIWAAVVLVFFSIPSSKLVGYVLPALPAIAALIAINIKSSKNLAYRSKILLRIAATAAVSCLISSVAIFYVWWHDTSNFSQIGKFQRPAFNKDDQLIMLNGYQYDLPFYLNATKPAWVVDRWNDYEMSATDNWRKELADATRFSPEDGSKYLITSETLSAKMCNKRNIDYWVWGNSSSPKTFPWLSLGNEIYSNKRTTLWHVRFSPELATKVCALK